MSNAILCVRGLMKRYGKITAVDGVDLDVRAGEFVVLLGPNGAGKTTLFQMLTGLFAPDAGTATIFGCDIRKRPADALASIGVVFQQPTLDLTMSVSRNLRFYAKLHGIPRVRRERAIEQALAVMGLAEQAHHPARTLSGGNRRRVELARALLIAPRLLLMDEPSVGLDPASRRDLLTRVRLLCQTHGLAVLWATHLIDEAAEADRIVVMERGRVAAEASPAQLLTGTGAATLPDAFHALTSEAGVARAVT